MVIDKGDASAIDLERIISADYGLSVALLRVANAQRYSSDSVTSIRSAVICIGQQAVRNLSMSLVMQSLVHTKSVPKCFQNVGYARHALVTAYTSRYIHARSIQASPNLSGSTPDDVFAEPRL